ncbi:MAG TPA: tRNA (adenosine(37)-N6)-threonylcarbamoyltransferase complex transferase subunit TsaD [Chitinophagales bacterium]|nr:tRNA (adenosine(37)-N6)-threonylcarbamoyltransferase complex transferase subunit TsaD [Chitinophagales bacterium]
MPVTILGIESSCDETAAAVLINGQIMSNVIAGQSVHEQYGGVVPELASRAHQANIVPVVTVALSRAGISLADLDAVAFTQGPGLLGALMVGTAYAKALAISLDIPLITVHHMQAHILAHLIEDPKPAFPFLCLTVSGGHTQIVRVNSAMDMAILGQTIDDAAGEAFDKCAKMLGLPYPGGPLIDKYAAQGNAQAFDFGEPKIQGLDFSFSGFKTSVLYFLQEQTKKNPDFVKNNLNDLCASVQRGIVEILLRKVKRAAKETGISRIAIAGGVSANTALRKNLTDMGVALGWEVFIPKFEYCTDNAAMIAITGYQKFLAGAFARYDVVPMARIPGIYI